MGKNILSRFTSTNINVARYVSKRRLCVAYIIVRIFTNVIMLFILVFARVVIRVIQLTLSARRERVQFSITIPYVLCSRTILSFLAVVASRKSPIIQVKKNKFFALEKNATPPLSFEKRISWKASIALCDRSEPLTRADDSFPSRTRATTELRLARRTDGRGRNL